MRSDVEIRETSGEDLLNVPLNHFDAVFTINAIDHGDDINACIDNISQILKSGGHLYLHVHCRLPEKINSLHRQFFSARHILTKLSENNLESINHKIFEKDPLSGKYETLVGIFAKQ